MRIINLFTDALIDLPVLDLASFGSNQNIIFIDLIQFCWLVTKFELLDIVFSSSFEIHDSDVHNALFVNREAEYSSRTLNGRLIPLDLDHAISLG